MKWLTSSIKEAAPSAASKNKFSESDQVWHLNLDQIESHTGKILDRRMAPASSAGNSTYVFDTNNVLYSKLRPYLNKVVCPDQPGIATTELVPLCPKPKVLDRKFLTYFLRSNRFLNFASVVVTGAKMPRVIMAKFWDYEIPLPPISEQRRIVEILDQADRLRKLREDADAKAQRIIPALFIKMFGDPAANPKGGNTVLFAEIVEIGTQLVDPNHPEFLDLPHIGGEHIEKETGRILSPTLVKDSNLLSNKFYFSSDHILLSKIRPYLNKVAYPRFNGVCSADIYPLRPKNNNVTHWYLVSLLRTQAFLDYANVHSDRLRIPKLNKAQLGAFEFPLPDPHLMIAFDERVEKIISVENFRFALQEKIEKLYQVILHRAFSGDLTASWREAHIKELLQEMERQSSYLEPMK